MDKRNFTVPFAIVVAGALVGGALFLSKGKSNTPDPAAVLESIKNPSETQNPIPPISENDHVLGNPQAPIILIEYSDTECPFCKEFHNTMHRVIDEYGKSGQVAWVYRHFPLAEIHAKAPKEAEATECAADLGGNTAFWNYLDKIYAITPSNNGLDEKLIPQIAEDIGLNRAEFESCLKSGKHTQKITDQFNQAAKAGGQGTPYSILMFGQNSIPIEGAQPYASIKGVVDQLLTQTGQTTTNP